MVLLVSCNSKENHILLDNKTSFFPTSSAVVSTPLQIDVSVFNSLFSKKLNRLFLYKVVKDNNCKTYISICSEKEGLVLYKNISTIDSSKILEKEKVDINNYKILVRTNNNNFIYHHIKQVSIGNKYLFSTISSDTTLIRQKYNSNQINKLVSTTSPIEQ